ncbi:VOC family protein [Herbiconiux daphne]|uniref:VOC domain-containing protein n=1 Tax=Herbiconiux daphne TaxID=2970914 RepID=A0ABT2H521_9MICO|nr:hypothetical protein [Herbiconiux daphne]MCS5735028.1 hypothetical protein [Herbiconiux daphne]
MHDVSPGNGMRIVQLTPPGSACSIVIGTGMSAADAAPVQGIHLVVDDIDAARAELRGRGVDVSPVSDLGGGFATPTSPTPTAIRGRSSRLPHGPISRRASGGAEPAVALPPSSGQRMRSISICATAAIPDALG